MTKEDIVHNILSRFAKKKELVKYEYSDGFYCFGNPDSQELADRKHEEWMKKKQTMKNISDTILGILMVISAIVIIGCVGYGIGTSLKPTAMDVYQGKTTLEITYRNGIPIDSVVVFKNK